MCRFLSRRTHSKFNKVVLKRLFMSSSVSISKLTKEMKDKQGEIATVVGTVTNDIRLTDDSALKLTLCCLRITKARARASWQLVERSSLSTS